MSVSPVNARSFTDLAGAARLEYDVFFDTAGEYAVDLVTGATLQVDPGRELAVAVGLNDLPPQIGSVFSAQERTSQQFLGKANDENARSDCRRMRLTLRVAEPGRHLLKIYMVDPTIVLQSIIVSRDDNLAASYFGPPPRRLNHAGE